MTGFMSNVFQKTRLAAITAVFIVSAVTAGVVALSQPQTVQAAPTCPQTQPQNAVSNIAFCGLDGTSVSTAVSSLKTIYTNNNDGHNHTDLVAVYDDMSGHIAGAKLAPILSSTDGWSFGWSNKNGTITDANGQLLATDMLITSRCLANMSNCPGAYISINDKRAPGVFLHSASTLFGEGTQTRLQTLIHINKTTGTIDFAIWVDCGNALFFRPVVPKKALVCSALKLDSLVQNDSVFTAALTATATATNMSSDTITFTIDFGDGSATVSQSGTGVTTQKFTHQFTQTSTDQSFLVKVIVNKQSPVPACQTTVKIPAKPPVKTLACVSLIGNPAGDNVTFNFVATAQASNTSVPNSFTFDFGDGSQPVTVTGTVNGQTSTATTSHAYNSGIFTASFSAKNSDGAVTPDSANCKTPVKPVPGEIVKTGPEGTVGLMAVTTAAGFGIHQFRMRRKLNA